MPTLHAIQQEVASSSPPDTVRRKYLAKLNKKTGRPTVLYASAYSVRDVPSNVSAIGAQDVQLFMAALHGIRGQELDLVLHSQGGSAEAVEQIVNYLRSKFTNIRVIIPQSAMSAATMLACAADRIVMGKHSALGPIDPQLMTPGGMVPAQSVLDEYELAKKEIQQSPHMAALWANKMTQYPPGILIVCENLIQRSRTLVEHWLNDHMFKGQDDGATKAKAIADWLGTHGEHLTHGHPISIQLARDKGLVVDSLEDDQDFQELVLSVFHATVATFLNTGCAKLVENHLKRGAMIVQQTRAGAGG